MEMIVTKSTFVFAMPFAPKIRKDILNALEEHIIPTLQTTRVTQILAEPPFDFSTVEHEVTQKKWLADREVTPFQTNIRWARQRLLATKFPRIMFVFDGTCITRVGITHKTAQLLNIAERKKLGGINVLTLHAPTILCHPAFMVHGSGAPYPNGIEPQRGILYCKVTKTDVRILLNIRKQTETITTHNLEINDNELARTAHLYLDQLHAADFKAAQQLQLTFMLRLQQYLLHRNAIISNSCLITPPSILPAATKVLSEANLKLCNNLTEYIIHHLHSNLTLKNLAELFHVSTVHLNFIFKCTHNTTVMRFVTRMRIKAAKGIIANTPERINDVARLVGFSSIASFSTVFQRHTGQSPGQYRKTVMSKAD